MTRAVVAEHAHPGPETVRGGSRARVQRLRASRDVRAVFAARGAAASPVAIVHARRRGDQDAPRATVVAGRKVGSAVERNRVKRRLRALLGQLPLREGVDYVVVGRRAALAASSEQLRASLARQVKQVGGQ